MRPVVRFPARRERYSDVLASRKKVEQKVWKDHLSTIKTVVEILAIGVAAAWALKIYIQQRDGYPHGQLVLSTKPHRVSDQVVILQVKAELKNIGKTMIYTSPPTVYVQQVAPGVGCRDERECYKNQIDKALNEYEQPSERFLWPKIAGYRPSSDAVKTGMRLEPGENLTRDFEFAVRGNVKVVRVYASIPVPDAPNEEVWDDAVFASIADVNVGDAK